MSNEPPSPHTRPQDQSIASKPLQIAKQPVSSLAVYCAKLPNSSINSLCGAAAGVASGIVTCPLDVIKTRLQAQGSFRRSLNSRLPSTALYNGMIGTAKTIWQQDGIRGMYRGLGPMLLGYLPTWAVYMTVYDASKDYYSTHIGQYCNCIRQ
jgi:solute carrier family 25 folate transporter 32